MNLIKLNIIGLSYSQFKSGAYALFLEEDNGLKKLSIVIGACEAQAIAIGLDKNIISPRPLTHDLFSSIADKSDLLLDKVIIHKLEKGIFFSSITFFNKTSNKSFLVDARTSDAIAIAIRFNAPIYTYKTILEKANDYLKEDKKESEEKNTHTELGVENTKIKQTAIIHLEELEKKLANAIQNEDYELAAKIRDQIKKLNK
jgi:bifunctional DNase/RNase|tara:strand:+ start:200 stop:802 length:603 start_codon:yes stop_codon:yes gene_type:complete